MIPAFVKTWFKIGEGALLGRLGPISYLRLTKASPVAVGFGKKDRLFGLGVRSSLRSSSPLGIILAAAYVTRSAVWPVICHFISMVYGAEGIAFIKRLGNISHAVPGDELSKI